VPTYRNGIFRLPAFVRAGAILPHMYVDENTKDAFGHRMDGVAHNELIVNVYAGQIPSTFTLYEDDGSTLNYTDKGRPFYEYRTTAISQQQTGNTVNVTIDPALNLKGNQTANSPYPGAVTSRANIVKLVVNNAGASTVTLNGQALAKKNSKAEFDAASSAWYAAGDNLILAKSVTMDVGTAKVFSFSLQAQAATTSANFVCDAGFTLPGQSIYVVGSIPELGNWDPAKAVKLDPNIYYDYISRSNKSLPGPTEPVWTGVISHLPANTAIEWKCIRREENAAFNRNTVAWEPGSNNKLTTTASGYAGQGYGKM
jgi:hypothetical protein